MIRNEKKRQSGFTLVVGVLVVLFITVIATSWIFVRMQSTDEASDNTTSSKAEQIVPEEPPLMTNVARKTFSANGVKISLMIPEGWESESDYVYPSEKFGEYGINIFNKEKDIQLHLQIMDIKSNLYEQSILQNFKGIVGETYYLTESVDSVPGDTNYEQIGISQCDNGHCPTRINEMYSLNANIVPVGPSTTFNGNESNLDDVKAIFASIVIN